MLINMMISNRKGFSLTELIVVMGIFMSVLIITATAFNTVLSQSGKQFKSAETQIEGIVGLELFRSDLQQAGYGLPRGFTDTRWLFPTGSNITYAECTENSIDAIDPKSLNDAPSGIPRGVMSVNGNAGSGVGFNGSDYLVIKSTVSGVNATSKKSNYLNYSSSGGIRKIWNSSKDLVTNERVIVIRSSFVNLVNFKQLVVNGGGNFYTTVPARTNTFPPAFSPPSSTDTYLVYGVDPDTDLRMPFNRTDYFVRRPDVSNLPAYCAPNTGILYKAMVNQGNGGYTFIPLLDCVVNLQVVYSLSSNSNEVIDRHVDASFGTPGAQGALPGDPTLAVLWNQLREIRVYILAQNGRKDPGYSYPNQTVTLGEFGMGSDIDLATVIGAEWNRYHWKVYTIVIQPKSLN